MLENIKKSTKGNLAKVGSKICRMLNKPFKMALKNSKWRNFTQSGHA